MSRFDPIGEGPSGSRIDDLGATHISVSPEIGRFEDDDHPGAASGPCPRGGPLAEPRGDAVEPSHAWGPLPTGRF
jgi:hypothetical protein